MKRSVGQGWIQGYNAQAVSNVAQIALTAYVTQDAFDSAQPQPAVKACQQQLAAVGIDEPIGVGLADAGYWSQDNATAQGMPDLLIATTKDWKQRKAARELGQTEGPAPEDASSLEPSSTGCARPKATPCTNSAAPRSSPCSARPSTTVASAPSPAGA